MSAFPRIPPDHPLTEAARYNNAFSEEQGLHSTVEWLDMGVSTGQLAYLAEQRAFRVLAAGVMGHNLGTGTPAEDNALVFAIMQTPLWKDFGPMLMGAIMDAISIGWQGHKLSLKPEVQATAMSAEDAISTIHTLASAEVTFTSTLNAPGQRGNKGAARTLNRVRLESFSKMVGRKPTDEEREKLLYGDS